MINNQVKPHSQKPEKPIIPNVRRLDYRLTFAPLTNPNPETSDNPRKESESPNKLRNANEDNITELSPQFRSINPNNSTLNSSSNSPSKTVQPKDKNKISHIIIEEQSKEQDKFHRCSPKKIIPAHTINMSPNRSPRTPINPYDHSPAKTLTPKKTTPDLAREHIKTTAKRTYIKGNIEENFINTTGNTHSSSQNNTKTGNLTARIPNSREVLNQTIIKHTGNTHSSSQNNTKTGNLTARIPNSREVLNQTIIKHTGNAHSPNKVNKRPGNLTERIPSRREVLNQTIIKHTGNTPSHSPSIIRTRKPGEQIPYSEGRQDETRPQQARNISSERSMQPGGTNNASNNIPFNLGNANRINESQSRTAHNALHEVYSTYTTNKDEYLTEEIFELLAQYNKRPKTLIKSEHTISENLHRLLNQTDLTEDSLLTLMLTTSRSNNKLVKLKFKSNISATNTQHNINDVVTRFITQHVEIKNNLVTHVTQAIKKENTQFRLKENELTLKFRNLLNKENKNKEKQLECLTRLKKIVNKFFNTLERSTDTRTTHAEEDNCPSFSMSSIIKFGEEDSPTSPGNSLVKMAKLLSPRPGARQEMNLSRSESPTTNSESPTTNNRTGARANLLNIQRVKEDSIDNLPNRVAPNKPSINLQNTYKKK